MLCTIFAAVVLVALVQEKPQPKEAPRSYRLPAVDLKQRVIWFDV